MGLGVVALRHLLVGELDLGDDSVSVSSEPAVHAHAGIGRRRPPLSWFRYGLLWGITALINTSVIAWLPFSGCWLAYQLHRRSKRFVIPAVCGALVFWATLMPWPVRNYSMFGKLIFVRGDLGVELRSGNNPLSNGEFILSINLAIVALSAGNAGRWVKRCLSLNRVIWNYNGSPSIRSGA